MNQSEAQREEERAIFAAFFALHSTFAGEPILNWRLADSDPPDVLCLTASRRTIGVELVEWLHLAEMRAGRLREAIGRQLIDAIGAPQPLNTSDHFDMVILHPKDRVGSTRVPTGSHSAKRFWRSLRTSTGSGQGSLRGIMPLGAAIGI